MNDQNNRITVTNADAIFRIRHRAGIIVSLCKDDAVIPDSLTASVLHNQAPLNEQMRSEVFALIKPDRVFAYSSEEAALCSSAFFYGDWWNEGYYPEDLCREWDITPIYSRYLWIVSINTDARVPYARTVRLDAHQAINAQFTDHRLTKVYLCCSKAEAESLASRWNTIFTTITN